MTELLTVEQVANILQVDRKTVYREIQADKIQAHYNGTYRIRREDLEVYVANSAGQKRPKRIRAKVEVE